MADRKTRISLKVRTAIAYMTDEGLSRSDSAAKAGISDNWLYQQLRRPEVLALRSERLKVIRTSAASRTIARAETLADTAQSEHVRNDANQWLASLDPDTSPVQRNETVHRYPDGRPGLSIVFQSAHDPLVIDGEVQVMERPKHIRHLPPPVPHPSQLARMRTPDHASAAPKPKAESHQRLSAIRSPDGDDERE